MAFTYDMNMVRLHRSLAGRLKSVDPGKVADRAEDYLESMRDYRRVLDGVRGLVTEKRVKTMVKKIDTFDREMGRLEDKLDKLTQRRAEAAVLLEDDLGYNLQVLEDYLDPDELRDFNG